MQTTARFTKSTNTNISTELDHEWKYEWKQLQTNLGPTSNYPKRVGWLLQQLDKMYKESIKWLDYQEIDSLVHIYKDEKASSQTRGEARNQLLHAYHKYFLKYTALLKGITSATSSKDTTLFLALFNSGRNGRHSFKALNSITRKKLVNICRHLDTEEVYNELVIIFLSLLDKFTFQPGVSFAHYITQYMRWNIKAWLLKLIREPTTFAVCNTLVVNNELEKQGKDIIHDKLIDLPALNLAWVVKPSQPIFERLSQYERFLLYLHFKEGLSQKQISHRLGRAKDTIYICIGRAMDKLRIAYQETCQEREEI